ncbi:MAG: hypothetical protein ACLFTI_00860 [Anaerolineales bacterium]
MIHHRWSIACVRAVVDRYTNNVSLEHIIEQITVQGALQDEGAIPIELDVMILWEIDEPKDADVYNSRLVVVGPDKKELASNEMKVNLTKHKRSRNRIHLQGLPFQGFGHYVLRVDLKQENQWEAVGSIHIDVVQRDALSELQSSE